ncbi:MAG TPA: glycosyltransferase family 4 protein, partial [bacterium]|nr:glycosyltransferase family 4 protein [bacterium]
MKVVQFASSSTWTGEMAHVFSLSRSLANRGAEITLAFRTIRKGKGIPLPGEKATEFGFSSVLALNLDSGFYPFQMVSDLRKLIRHIDREGIQVLHTHRGQDHWLAVVASKLSSRKPHVVRTRHVSVALRTHILNRWLFEQTD